MVPLANDANGDPIELPAEAAFWRIRRLTGGRGAPPVIYHHTGVPLLLDIEATADDLREAGCGAGRYRLEACDADKKPLGILAFTEIDGGEVSAEPTPDKAPESELVTLLRDAIASLRASNEHLADGYRASHERLADALSHSAEAMARAFGPVRPAKPEPITVEAIAVPPEAAPATAPEPPNYLPMILALLQHAGPVIGQVMSAVQAARTPAVAPSTGAGASGPAAPQAGGGAP